MRPGGGKAKGSQFERDVARRLSLWWSEGTDPNCLWRTHSSGGFGTVAKVEGQYGDISGINALGMEFSPKLFVVECKNYKEIDFSCGLGRSTSSIILQWWTKIQVASNSRMLIMKANNRRIVIAVATPYNVTTRYNIVAFRDPADGKMCKFVLTDFEEWLQMATPKRIRLIAREIGSI